MNRGTRSRRPGRQAGPAHRAASGRGGGGATGRSDDLLVDVRVEALAPGGDAVGRQEGGAAPGRVVFVALAAPGEVVRARLTRQKERVAWADLESVLPPPSSERVAPPCPWFGRCGGCQWQHVSLAVQQESKRRIVARALGGAEVALRAPTPTGVAYRERVRLVVGPHGALGFRGRRSHAVVDVERCLLLTAALERVLAGLRQHAQMGDVLGAGSEVELLAGREGIHLGVHAAPAGPVDERMTPRRAPEPRPQVARGRQDERESTWHDFWQEMRPHGVIGLTVDGGGARGRALHFGLSEVDVSEDASDGVVRPLAVPAGAFAQVGRLANAALVAAACDAVGTSPGRVLELHAGSGNFTRHLVSRALAVIASDGDADARARGRRNVPGARWVDDLASGDDPTWVPDTVFVDPPRAGLDAVAMSWARRARRQIVYVSCDPQTLGRDVRTLVAGGFRLDSAVALDLMPHTHHVEVVCRLVRAAPASPEPHPVGPQAPGDPSPV